jgi:transposase InsO family protein
MMRAAFALVRKKVVLDYARGIGNAAEACRGLKVPRSAFYRWKARYELHGESGLLNKKPVGKHWRNQLSDEVVEKVPHLRREYHMGPQRITWYLERYHGIKTSCSTVDRTLVRHGMRHLPWKVGRRSLHSRRYAKRVPGHHVQVDVKFLALKTEEGHQIRRFQYTAIDDATRIRALKIYRRHTQKNAIDFADYVIEKFPFRIHTMRTDRGHEFQALFHWHVEDKGIEHIYIKPRTPQLNGKVDRSHRTDQEEFYQLLTYTDDVNLNEKPETWEKFYKYDRPHGALGGKTPYDAPRSLLTLT